MSGEQGLPERFPVPAYAQAVWVQSLLSSPQRVGIMERAVLLAMVLDGEIEVASEGSVGWRHSEDIAAVTQFAPGDVFDACLAMSYRGWLRYRGEGDGFVLACVGPAEQAVESAEAAGGMGGHEVEEPPPV